MTSKPNLKTGPRLDRHNRPLVPSMHTFALRHPWYWERLRWLRKWTIENWTKGYVRAEGPPGTKGFFDPTGEDWVGEPQIPMATAGEKRAEVNGLALAEAVSSEDIVTGKHHILIDIDRPCELIPSTSKDHFHLYVQMGSMGDGMDFTDYAEWLAASAKIGLIEPGYAEASIRRGATFLRLPWIRKGKELEDRQRALGIWLESEGVDLNGQRDPSTPPL